MSFDGKWIESSTGLRIDSVEDTAKANRMADKATLKERQSSTTRDSAFDSWVPTYLASHYTLSSPSTRRRTEIVWHTLSVFLHERGIRVPRQVSYRIADEYMQWRIGRVVNLRAASHNTARMEIKFLSQLMSEAVRRELADANPFLGKEIPLAPQKEKKALTDKDIANVRSKIGAQAPWMSILFETMLHTGCRFNEASIPIKNVDFDKNDLHMVDSKRNYNDRRKQFTIPLPKPLRALFWDLKQKGRDRTVELTSEKNWRFNRFLKEIAGASSHSLRVTFITRCQQAGLSERQTMRLVNHSSHAVHAIYSRLSVDDVREAQSRIPIPSFSVAIP
jgi:site-specific recombinase XerD